MGHHERRTIICLASFLHWLLFHLSETETDVNIHLHILTFNLLCVKIPPKSVYKSLIFYKFRKLQASRCIFVD